MNFTKYMCKKFNKENKGFVTIEDIKDELCKGENILLAIFLSFIFVGLIIVVILTGDIYHNGLTPNEQETFYELFSIKNFVVGSLIWMITIFVISILYKLWSIIKTIKVVKCPLKKE